MESVPNIADLIPPKDVYLTLGIPYTTMKSWIAKGRLTGYKIGDTTYVIRDEKYEKVLSELTKK